MRRRSQRLIGVSHRHGQFLGDRARESFERKTAAGTGTAIAAGGDALVRCDGTNVVGVGAASVADARSPT
jgi:hypothetical protein